MNEVIGAALRSVARKRSDKEKTGSFGRYLAEVYVEGVNVNDWLIAEGYAVPW